MVCACSAPLDKGADVGIKSTNCRRRLIRDFKRLSTDPPGGVSGSPCPDNIMLWNAVIFGPGQFITSLLSLGFGLKKQFARRHTFWRWHIQTLTNVRWVLSQQTTLCEILVEDVPSQHLCQWGTLSWYSAEQMVTDIWCRCDFDEYTESATWSEPE